MRCRTIAAQFLVQLAPIRCAASYNPARLREGMRLLRLALRGTKAALCIGTSSLNVRLAQRRENV
jgi:hypothetical protein